MQWIKKLYPICILVIDIAAIESRNSNRTRTTTRTTADVEHGDDVSPSVIVGGDDVKPGEYPYFVDMNGCGGTLIGPDVVLTAAHCDFGIGLQLSVPIYVGAVRSNSAWGGAKVRECVEWIRHPRFTGTVTDGYDFALCKLDSPVEIHGGERKVRLELNEDRSVPGSGDGLIVLGAGRTQLNPREVPEFVQYLQEPYIQTGVCNSSNVYDGRITDTMLCAGYLEGGKGHCSGDSGGPLIRRTPVIETVEEEEQEQEQQLLQEGEDSVVATRTIGFVDTLVGLVSWSSKTNDTVSGQCALGNRPGVFARISSGVDWIEYESCFTLHSTASFCIDKVCTNDPNFRYRADRAKDCNWVSMRHRQGTKICQRGYKGTKINRSCPLACKTCCADDRNYRYKNQKNKDCNWVRKQYKRGYTKICKRNVLNFGGSRTLVEDSCPSSCGVCCGNDEKFRYESDYEKDCEWVKQKIAEGSNANICGERLDNNNNNNNNSKPYSSLSGETIGDACPLACGYCSMEEV